jgi:hypothetical protein
VAKFAFDVQATIADMQRRAGVGCRRGVCARCGVEVASDHYLCREHWSSDGPTFKRWVGFPRMKRRGS